MADSEKITVEVEIDEKNLRTFLSFLAKVEELGKTGESELVSLFVGDLKATFKHGLSFSPEVVKRGSIGYVFDAG